MSAEWGKNPTLPSYAKKKDTKNKQQTQTTNQKCFSVPELFHQKEKIKEKYS